MKGSVAKPNPNVTGRRQTKIVEASPSSPHQPPARGCCFLTSACFKQDFDRAIDLSGVAAAAWRARVMGGRLGCVTGVGYGPMAYAAWIACWRLTLCCSPLPVFVGMQPIRVGVEAARVLGVL